MPATEHESTVAFMSSRLASPVSNQNRRSITSQFRKALQNTVTVHPLRQVNLALESDVNHLFVILCNDREKLQQYFEQRGIQTLIHYPVALHQQRAFIGVSCDPNGLPHAERFSQSCLSLPCNPQMTERQVELVVEALLEL